MTGIKAFVGHSFTSGDEAVVNSFLTFFGQLEALLDNFSWKHAKKAEPKDLAVKVLETAEDCNTLIAICTRKELIIGEDLLRPSPFSGTQVKAARSDFLWKTSDWVIQEIGLAVGRGMSIIILLEVGCRKPGGLQGDVEYIPFERSAPERAHGQLLEMLKALNPLATTAPPTAGEPKTEEQPDNFAESEEETRPDASWDIERFENQFFWALFNDRPERVEEIDQAFLESVHAKGDEEKASWQAATQSWKLLWGKGGSVSAIQTCAASYPENTRIITALAVALGQLGQEEEAARLYERAAACEKEASRAIGHLSSAAYWFMRASKPVDADSLVERIREITEPDQRIMVARALKSNAEVKGDNHLKIEAMEAIARFEPDNQDNRFSLAYAHSEMGSSELALHHYLLIPDRIRSTTTWNNVGVAYQNLSLPGRAVAAYKRAAIGGETLAMSNLAYRFMNAGFFAEAEAEIARAMNDGIPHRNVGEAIAHLADLPDSETKSVKEIEAVAVAKVAFYRDLSQAILQPTIKIIQGGWIGPKGPISIVLSGTEFGAVWEFETPGNALTGLLASKPNRYRVELSGQMVGRRAHGILKHKRLDGTPSIFGDIDSERSFSIVFSDDIQTARVAENLEKKIPTFYEIKVANQLT